MISCWASAITPTAVPWVMRSVNAFTVAYIEPVLASGTTGAAVAKKTLAASNPAPSAVGGIRMEVHTASATLVQPGIACLLTRPERANVASGADGFTCAAVRVV